MSDLSEKLAPSERPRHGLARAKLSQLAIRWGAEPIDTKYPPQFVLVHAPTTKRTETWKRVGGAGGKDTLYELIEEAPTPAGRA